MSKTHWDRLYQGTPQQEPESRRHEQVAAGVTEQLAGLGGPILLLGVSPTLSRIGSDVTAVDRTHGAARARWPGNGPGRRAVVADWLRLPFPAASFTACI